MAAGMMPAAMIWLTALLASSTELKIARIARWCCGLGVRRTQTLVTIASVPSLPVKTPIRSSPGRIVDRPELNDRAVAEHGLHAEHVVDGHAVLERVRTAGIGGHVAADGAGALARRVGGEVEAGAGQGLSEPQVGHARLDHGHPVAQVDLEDSIHPGQHDHHAAADRTILVCPSAKSGRLAGPCQRQATARQAGARSARDHRRAVSPTEFDDLGNLPRGARQNHRLGPVPLDREGVTIVDRQFRRRREHVLAAECRSKLGNEAWASTRL